MNRKEHIQAINERRRLLTNMDRFIPKMGAKDENGCIRFQGFVAPAAGYGSFAWKEQAGKRAHNLGAHVASYRLFKGEVPTRMLVRHTCDNRACVNPEHLVVGTQKENMQDCIERRRTARGTQQHLAVMSEARVRELRERHAAGETGLALAAAFGISNATVSQIIRRVTWRHV